MPRTSSLDRTWEVLPDDVKNAVHDWIQDNITVPVIGHTEYRINTRNCAEDQETILIDGRSLGEEEAKVFRCTTCNETHDFTCGVDEADYDIVAHVMTTHMDDIMPYRSQQ